MKKFGFLMIDCAGLEPTAQEIKWLQDARVCGVILFARHFKNRAQLCALTAQLKALRGVDLPPLIITVDHEGGRVQRFKTDGFTHLPAMRKLGALWEQNPLNALKAAQCAGLVLAAELRACGVDLSFTPVLDLDWGASGVIGDRAFHSDARVVSVLSRSVMQGLKAGGMHNCGKHFPGHGFAAADSHIAVPVDERGLKDILAADALPYEALNDVLTAVMPAHVIYPQIDSQPAGFSKKWVQSILRKKLGFRGAVFSDDLSMEGATVAGDIHARLAAAQQAGCDIALICNSPDLTEQALSRPHKGFSAASQARVASLAQTPPALASDWQSLQANSDYQFALQTLRGFDLIQ